MRLVQQKYDFFESFIKRLDKQIEQIHTILKGIALLGEITPRARDKSRPSARSSPRCSSPIR